MNQIAKLGETVAVAQSDGGFEVTPSTLADVVEFAKFMSLSNAGIPGFLRSNAPDCAMVTMQALQWGMNPFSVAQKAYKVKDIIAYEAQLIAAVVNSRSGMTGRLKYEYEGEGSTLRCTVTGKIDGENYVYVSPEFGEITTKNSPLWKSDPQQQLGYYSSRAWARRYTPEVLLGVYDREEANSMRDVTPAAADPSERLKQAQIAAESAQDEQEGFSTSHVQETLNDDPETPESEPEAIQDTEAESSPAPVDDEGGESNQLMPPSDELLAATRALFQYGKDAENDTEENRPEYRGRFKSLVPARKKLVPEHEHDQLEAIVKAVDAVIKGEQDYETSVGFFAEAMDFDPETFEINE